MENSFARVAMIASAVGLAVAVWAGSASAHQDKSNGNKPHVVCITSDAEHWRSPKRPHTCIFHKRGESWASAYLSYVQHIRWRQWSRHSARGTGILRGNMGFKAHVRVHLRAPRHGHPHRKLYYSRLELRGSKGVNYHIGLDVPRSNYI